MKAILAGLVLTALIGGASVFALSEFQRRAFDTYASDTGTRVGDPGHNLVGPEWSGAGGAEGEETGS